MIGQAQLLSQINTQLQNNKFPHFTIFEGLEGSGRTTLAKYVANALGASYAEIETRADAVRTMREVALTTATKTFFCIRNADNMSAEAKNSILKITEECPANVYICMTVENVQAVLDTIRSRAVIYYMEAYTPAQILEYASEKVENRQFERDIIVALCETPGEVETLLKIEIRAFYDYVNQVVDNIAIVTGANAFKIADKLALKSDSEGYPIKLFFRAFLAICASNLDAQKAEGIRITSRYLQQLQNVSLSKQMLIDAWILDIRGAWLE